MKLSADQLYLGLARAGVIASVAALVAIAAMIVIDPTTHTVTPVYAGAVLRLLRGEALYDPHAIDGYLYSPTFALLYAALSAFGPILSQLLWRGLSVGLLVWALWRAASALAPSQRFPVLGLGLLISLFGALDAVRNGQSTTLLCAATLLAFESAHKREYVAAAGWAALAFVAKPLGFVVALLIAGAWTAAAPWVACMLLTALLAPFAYGDFLYVIQQYCDFVRMLVNITPGPDTTRGWTDFEGLLRPAGVVIAPVLDHAIRVAAGLATLIWTRRLVRSADYLTGAFFPATLACVYLLLFNPRAEPNTYLLMAAPFGLIASYFLIATKQRASGLAIAAACVALATGAFGHAVLELFNPWSKPLLLIVALAVAAAALTPRTKPIEADSGVEPLRQGDERDAGEEKR